MSAESVKDKITPMKGIRTISLFSGCGGSDFALKRLGYDVVWANDISDVACETYIDNVGSIIASSDISDFYRIPVAEFLVGYYPCQGFSPGGRRMSDDAINLPHQ